MDNLKKYLTDVIKEDYKNWKIGDTVFIKAGTGAGKSYFIKNKLNDLCSENGKYILFLTNRCILKEQVQIDIGTSSNIVVKNYQQIEELMIRNNLNITKYEYIVMDEAHYFFTDSAFNKRTDLFFNEIINNKDICKIFMTATPRLLTKYFNSMNINIDYTYELKPNYSYLNKIIAFNTYESINSIIEDIPNDEQIILFSSAKRSLEISKKYNGAFICSKHNKEGFYNKYVKDTENEKELNRIINEGKFNNHLLCTTTVFDNGININEGVPVKHIIIDVFDRDEFIQCLGRKRVNKNEKVSLYFYSWNDNKRINGFKTKINNTLKRADLLMKKGDIEYTKIKFKTDIADTRIIDDIVVDGEIHKVVNNCMYHKYKSDMKCYNSILSKNSEVTYKRIIASILQVNEYDIPEMETRETLLSIEELLESLVGKQLYKEDRKKLVEFIGLKDSNGRLQKSIGTLNAYLDENKLLYTIKSERKSYRDGNGKIKKTPISWVIYKLNTN